MSVITRRWMAGLLVSAIAAWVPAGLMAQDTAQAPSPAGAERPATRPLPPPDPAALLKVVPSDATAFLAVRTLSQLDAAISAVSARLGFPIGEGGMMPGALAMLKEQLGAVDGFNDNGGMAVVLMDISKARSVGDLAGHMVMLIPTTDFKALSAALAAEEKEGQLAVELMGSPAVIAEKQGFLVAASSPDALKAFMDSRTAGIAGTLSEDRVKAYMEHDVFLWVKTSAVPEALRKEVADAFRGLMTMGNPSGQEQTESSIAQMEKFFSELSDVSAAISLDAKRGLLLSFFLRAAEGTDLATVMSAAKPADGPLLVGLPDEPVVLAVGGRGSLTPQAEQQMRENAAGTIRSLDAADGDPIIPEATLTAIVDAYVKLVAGMEQVAISVSGLPAASRPAAQDAPATASEETGYGLLAVAAVLKVKDAAAWREQARKLFDAGKEVLALVVAKQMGDGKSATETADGRSPKDVLDAVQWREKAEDIGGASVDHMLIDLARIPDIDADSAREIKTVIGREGVLVRLGVVNEHTVVICFGGGPERFATVAGLAARGEAPLAGHKDLARVADRLPKANRTAEGYLNVDHLLKAVVTVAAQVGSPMPFPLIMQNAAPVAFVATQVSPVSQQVDVLVPIELAVSVSDMVKPIVGMMMMGGMGGETQGMPPQMTPLPDDDNGNN